ncbi:MAG: glycosyltransferase family 2 protein [Pyrinomonadaceae bacterium]|nr:glycosyltransferase family 2 protein [Pyrinomonadaceae bacterium]
MNNPKVTVCIPAYNRPEFLREALESLCDQGLNRDEYVVAISNDASPVSLDEVVSCFEEKLRIVYRRNCTNIGHIANFDRSLSLAKTPYVSFLPDDDLVAPGQLGRALKILETHPQVVLVSSLIVTQRYPGGLESDIHGFFLKGTETTSYSRPYHWDKTEWLSLSLVNTPLSMIGSLLRRETFHSCQLWKSYPLWHDRLMLAEIALHGDVVSLPWIGGYNRLGEHQLNAQLAKTHSSEFRETTEAILEMCRRSNIPVIDFWIEHICTSTLLERVRFLRMLNRALPAPVYEEIKNKCERRLETKLNLGWRLDRLGLPRLIVELIRTCDRRFFQSSL